MTGYVDAFEQPKVLFRVVDKMQMYMRIRKYDFLNNLFGRKLKTEQSQIFKSYQ